MNVPVPVETGAELQTHAIRRKSKTARILHLLAVGHSLNCFEAEKVGDHSLPQTVFRLQCYGISVARQEEIVKGWCGSETRVMRYWLSPSARERALELLLRAN